MGQIIRISSEPAGQTQAEITTETLPGINFCITDDHLLVGLILRDYGYKLLCLVKEFLWLTFLIAVAMMPAEVLITFRESFKSNLAHAVNMSERANIVHPLFASIRTNGTVKQLICTWIC